MKIRWHKFMADGDQRHSRDFSEVTWNKAGPCFLQRKYFAGPIRKKLRFIPERYLMTRSLLSKKSCIKLYYEFKLQARCQIAGRDDQNRGPAICPEKLLLCAAFGGGIGFRLIFKREQALGIFCRHILLWDKL